MNKKLVSLIFALILLSTSVANAGRTVLRKYGQATTIDFELFEPDGVALSEDWVPAQADCEIRKDGGAMTAVTATAVDEGATYSIVISSTEMEHERGILKIEDVAGGDFLTICIFIETYGNASAEHAFDFDASNISLSGGGASIQSDASGYIKVSDGTGTGQIDTSSGTVLLRSATETQIDNIENGTTLQNTTIATLASQTSFTLTAGSTDDDAYNDCVIEFEDASTGTQKCMGVVKDYTGSTKTVTLWYDPGVFTMQATDNVNIKAQLMGNAQLVSLYDSVENTFGYLIKLINDLTF